jgi:hypothetical protein
MENFFLWCDIMAMQDEFPCTKCVKRTRPICIHSDEQDWDWDTDDVCPGFIEDLRSNNL